MYSPKSDGRSISIVGAGRLGTALGIALTRRGYEVRLVVTKNSSTARLAARAIGKNVVGISEKQLASRRSNYAELIRESSLILIATPDDVIPEAAQTIANLLGRFPRSRNSWTVLHTSGALSSAELQPLKALGFATGSLHPLVSISEARSGSAMFRGSFFCVEGDRSAVRVAIAIAQALGGKTFTVEAKSKPLYHAAAVMASGHVIALFDLAVTMLQHCGLSGRQSKDVLLRLLKTSIGNLDTMKASDALTGPFARGDVKTVKRHLAALKSQNLRLALEAYVALGRQSLSLATSRRAPALKEIDKLLTDA